MSSRTVDAVLAAEAENRKLLEDAREAGEKLCADARREGEKLMEDAVRRAESERAALLEETDAAIEKENAVCLKKTEEMKDRIRSETEPRLGEAAESIVRIILG